jgi:hypothetical protein
MEQHLSVARGCAAPLLFNAQAQLVTSLEHGVLNVLLSEVVNRLRRGAAHQHQESEGSPHGFEGMTARALAA